MSVESCFDVALNWVPKAGKPCSEFRNHEKTTEELEQPEKISDAIKTCLYKATGPQLKKSELTPADGVKGTRGKLVLTITAISANIVAWQSYSLR